MEELGRTDRATRVPAPRVVETPTSEYRSTSFFDLPVNLLHCTRRRTLYLYDTVWRQKAFDQLTNSGALVDSTHVRDAISWTNHFDYARRVQLEVENVCPHTIWQLRTPEHAIDYP